MPTTEEIERLKRNWRSDPCWDIEDTEGFDAQREELLAYRLDCERQWEEDAGRRNAAETARLEARAVELGCPGAGRLVGMIESLADQVLELRTRLDDAGILPMHPRTH